MNKKITILYQKYGAMVFRRCKSLLGDDALANDAAQDVFVAVIHKYNQLSLSTPSSLLYRIATNVCLNTIRSKKRERNVFNPDYDDDLLERIASLEEPENNSIHEQMLKHLFNREPESSRTIAVMYLLDGFTLKEVAEEVNMSVSGVRKRLRRLKGKLKELEEVDDAVS